MNITKKFRIWKKVGCTLYTHGVNKNICAVSMTTIFYFQMFKIINISCANT